MLKNAASLIFSLIFLFVVALPLQAQNSQESVRVKVSPTEFSDPLGSFVQGEIELTNTSDQEIDLKIGIVNDKEKKIGSNVTGFFGSLRFYGDLPEDFESLLNDSNGSVSEACEKRDDSNDLDNWCDGEKVFSVTIKQEQKILLPYTFRIPLTVEATKAFLHVESVSPSEDESDEDQENEVVTEQLFTQQLQYTPPKIEIVSSEIRELKLKRSFGKLNFWSWMRAGFREAYDGSVTIENTGTQKMPYNLALNIQRPNTDDESIKRSGEIAQGEQVIESFEGIKMPRLGTALIDAQLSYEGNDGPQSTQTDQARVANTPLKEIVGSVFFCLALIIGFIVFRKTQQSPNQESKTNQNMKNKFSKNNQHSFDQNEVRSNDDDRYQTYGEDQRFTQNREMPEVKTRKNVRKTTAKASSRNASKKSVALEQRGVYADDKSSQRGPSPLVVKGVADDSRGSKKMDMDWIGEDDAMFDSAMRLQEKAMNMKVGALVLGIIAVCILTLVYLGNKYLFSNEKDDGVSIVELNEQDSEVSDDVANDQGDIPKEEVSQEDAEQPEDVVADAKDTDDTVDDQPQEKEEETVVKTDDLIVQVLNAGTSAGAAGNLTETLGDKGYEVLAATNARNDYVGNVVYHAKAGEAAADKLINDIGSTYGGIDIEEAQFVLDIYNADLVVVLGS